MKLLSLSKYCLATASLLLLTILLTVIAIGYNQRALTNSQELRYQSYLAADERHQSADDSHAQEALIVRPIDGPHSLPEQRIDETVQRRQTWINRLLASLMALTGIGFAMAIVCFLGFRSRLLQPLAQISHALQSVAATVDADPQPLSMDRSDEIGEVARHYDGMLQRFNNVLDETHRETETALRVQKALDSSASSILVADENDHVVYMNAFGRKTMDVIEPYIRKSYPDFSKDEMHRWCWYDLHPMPERRAALKDLSSRHEEIIEFEGHSFRLHVNPVLNARGQYLGVIAECQNVTQKIEAEREREMQTERQLAQHVNTQVNQLLEIVNSAVKGDLTCQVTVKGEDAVGRVGEGIEALLQEFRGNLTHIRSSSFALSTSSTTLSEASVEISKMTLEGSTDIVSMHESSNAMKGDVSSVATAMEAMSAAIRHIAQNAGEAALVANQAVELAQSTDTTVRELSESSTSIGSVLKVITSIAEQTNLLALNATIEAARAGDAGKGFAVVANEVKELAKETARATEQIAGIIDTIQTNSGNAVVAITSIGNTINKINDIQNDIAQAVDEQTANTLDMSRNVQNAVVNSDNISRYSQNTLSDIAMVKLGTDRLTAVSDEISQMADQLRCRIERYKLEA
ncbi:methyl-accepting chemotaxis protein [Granulosicoccus antarcticus]|uniref:Methyl-accepting chemotaxis protein II n=1 Tax=Granulosicoccus antarcticus IMCC3135 TaxID=1192854 RepID=A0A2Z2NLL3_9GAMM|nr:methyl-accepting chemotaxis protein [Granulosicoccus antarcticus]ASJ70668.1 Methyl-accepting chemotaxis protein II [Granulosicoccus antarcticus IMCC3135]